MSTNNYTSKIRLLQFKLKITYPNSPHKIKTLKNLYIKEKWVKLDLEFNPLNYNI